MKISYWMILVVNNIKALILMPLLCAMALFLWGCREEKESVETLSGQTMGTYWQVKIAEKNQIPLLSIQKGIEKELEFVNQSMSTYIEDSELMRWNNNNSLERVAISDELYYVVNQGLKISAETDGAYDITIGALVNLWGFGAQKRSEAPTEEEISAVLAKVGFEKVDLNEEGLRKLHSEVEIDLSSIAKGYGVDRLAQYLVAQDVENFIIEIGGEIRAQGNRFGEPWRIGVEMPEEGKRHIESVILIKDRQLAMASSGNYRNFIDYDGVHATHTLDRKTGKSVQSKLLSVTVLAEEAIFADAYATALMALGSDGAEIFAEQHNIPALFIFAGDEVDKKFIVRQSKMYQTILSGGNL